MDEIERKWNDDECTNNSNVPSLLPIAGWRQEGYSVKNLFDYPSMDKCMIIHEYSIVADCDLSISSWLNFCKSVTEGLVVYFV